MKSSKKGFWILLMIAVPAMTILAALGGAKLILSGAVSESKLDLIAGIAVGLVALVLSMFGAFHAKQKKFIWGMLYAAAYLALLMLSNLLFFGEGYGAILPNAAAAFTGGVIGSMIGGGKRRPARRT